MNILKTIPVLFNQEEHTYCNTETGEMLKGVTGTLLHLLFPDKYKDIPEHILANAAARGTLVHEDIELCETMGTEPTTEEGKNYLVLKEENALRFLASEHTVSDLVRYASQIDLVYDVEEGVVDIADIKTTSKFDGESVGWQLSIYAYLLELNNPGLKVRNLYGIWLRGEIAELVQVLRHGADEVEALMKAEAEGVAFGWRKIPSYVSEREDALITLSKRIETLTDEYDRLRAELLADMEASGEKSVDTGRIKVTYIAPSKRTSFNQSAFKEAHADLYEQYIKTSETKPSVKITIK